MYFLGFLTGIGATLLLLRVRRDTLDAMTPLCGRATYDLGRVRVPDDPTLN